MHVLDNPIWRALGTRQVHLGRTERRARIFAPEVSVLGGLEDDRDGSYADLVALLAPGAQVGLFVAAVPAAADLEVRMVAPLVQMVRETDELPPAAGGAEQLVLGEADVPEMMALAELTKPGPFARRTREMGDYFGVRAGDGALVAMAGERLHVPGYTELSAVCTHPDHLGNGHAAALMSTLIRRILARGERPFLHVKADNLRAIAVYERLGFATRLRARYVILQRR